MADTTLQRPTAASKQRPTVSPSPRRESGPGGEVLESFHPVIQAWFHRHFDAPTDAQAAGWPVIRSGRDVLIAAPTGSGKTLAAFLAGLDSLIREAEAGDLPVETQIVYVSPLKALGNDIQRNLEAPLQQLAEVAAEMGVPFPAIRTAVRTGDTPQKERQAILKTPPHILITTPESLYLMLTAQRARETLRHVRTVIVDEIHALARDKRGSHLALTLARLDHINESRPARIGLSATQRPVEEIAAFLVGTERGDSAIGQSGNRPREHEGQGISLTVHSEALEVRTPHREKQAPRTLSSPSPNVACPEALEGGRELEGGVPLGPVIVDLGHQRDIDLAIEVPPSDLEAIAAKEQWADIYDRLAGLVRAHRTTLIFVNNRRLSERLAHNLRERLGEEAVASHHGSLSRERRLRVEQRLKAGELQALVCTASLELGIDIGSIDLVCQIGSPRSVATFLQRVGRSGHALGLRPQGRLFPTTRDELVECAALVRAVKAGRLDRIVQPVAPLDVLAQQIVAETACEDWSEDALFELTRRAWPYRDLSRNDFDEIVEMLSEGVGEGAGRAPPLVHRDRINGVLRGRRGARMSAILNGGTIPEMADYRVVAEPDDTVVGTVGEDWAIESMSGDIFLLGSNSWRIKRVAAGEVRVEDAHGAPPTIPFWVGEAPGRTRELSAEVGRLRRDVIEALGQDRPSPLEGRGQGEGSASETATSEHLATQVLGTQDAARDMIKQECGLEDLGASQIVDYLRASRDALGVIPSDTDVVFERFFDETGGMQLIVHAPFGSRINRAWGLTLRKRFCVRFDFELQAAASDDSIVLSLGPQHSFPLAEAFDYVTPRNAETSLRQAILYAPIFPVRWRWDAGRALAVPRYYGARKVPPPIQRMRADDLLAAVFPAQVGCQENLAGPLEIPDHPLIRQTVDDCMHEAMDLDGLIDVLHSIEGGAIRMHAIDTVEPSPMAHEILSGKPYTYLDDAPLEERRTRAVTLRRALPESARELGALDIDAIERVREEAWPAPRDAEEVHDALLSLVAVPEPEAAAWQPWLHELVASGRAASLAIGQSRNRPSNEQGDSFAVHPEALEGRTARVEDDAAGTPISHTPDEGWSPSFYFAAENLRLIKLLYPNAVIEPELDVPEGALVRVDEREDARGRLLRGWTEAIGPASAAGLGARTGLDPIDVERGLRMLEANGFVLRGRFSPGAADDEFCDRRLLARIHRYTLDRLRREIDPVSLQDFSRFLLRWQHLTADSKLAGKQGVRQAIARLEGYEAASGAWERELLAARVGDYKPSWLDELCLAGEVAWARLTPRKAASGNAGPSTAAATRLTPVSLTLRPDLPTLLAAVRASSGAPDTGRAGAASEVYALLQQRGALFFDEIVNGTRRLKTDVERALRQLVAWGLVTSDGFQGLRQLIGRGAHGGRPSRGRGGLGSGYVAGGLFAGGGPAGRWAPVQAPEIGIDQTDELAEATAKVLLQRYGVIFRDLYPRESFTLPWRDVLRALRRLEARGLVRGGRFVSGPSGEQYALPEAVDGLRWVRRHERTGERVWVSTLDPANLTGVLLPGDKAPSRAGEGTLFVDGLPQTPSERPPEASAVKTPVPSRLMPRVGGRAR